MPPAKKRRYHNHRSDRGTFAKRPDTAPKAPGINPASLNTQQQAWLAGSVPGWWISDHLSELRHFTGWVYPAVHKIAQQWLQATVNVYDDTHEDEQATVEKALANSPRFRHRPDIIEMARLCRRWRQKSHTPDTHAEQETPIPDHPAAELLNRPNPIISGSVFRYQVACQLRLAGGCFIWEVPFPDGMPANLWVIPKGWVRPMAPNGMYPQGYFQITPVFNTFTGGTVNPTQTTYNIPTDQMIDLKYPHPLWPGDGTSPVSACSQQIDVAEQLEVATLAGMMNSCKPSMVFNIDPRNGVMVSEDDLKRFTEQLESLKTGPNNAGKILAMLGLSVMPMMGSPSELDYVNGRDQARKNVFGIQGVSETVVGFGSSTSYSEAAVAAKSTIEFSVEPDLQLFGAELTHRWDKHWPGIRIELAAKAINDPELRLQKTDKAGQAFTAGVISANEYRAYLDEPPLDDPIADIPAVLLQPMLPEIGAPETGIAGMGDAEDPYAAFGSMDGVDTEDDAATETSTGMKKPDLQEAGGRMKKAFLLNGHVNGVAK